MGKSDRCLPDVVDNNSKNLNINPISVLLRDNTYVTIYSNKFTLKKYYYSASADFIA